MGSNIASAALGIDMFLGRMWLFFFFSQVALLVLAQWMNDIYS